MLQCIADSCPDGVMDGPGYEVKAAALQTRRLATVAQRGCIWRATLTTDATYFLANGAYPKTPNGRAPTPVPSPPAIQPPTPSLAFVTASGDPKPLAPAARR